MKKITLGFIILLSSLSSQAMEKEATNLINLANLLSIFQEFTTHQQQLSNHLKLPKESQNPEILEKLTEKLFSGSSEFENI